MFNNSAEHYIGTICQEYLQNDSIRRTTNYIEFDVERKCFDDRNEGTKRVQYSVLKFIYTLFEFVCIFQVAQQNLILIKIQIDKILR